MALWESVNYVNYFRNHVTLLLIIGRTFVLL